MESLCHHQSTPCHIKSLICWYFLLEPGHVLIILIEESIFCFSTPGISLRFHSKKWTVMEKGLISLMLLLDVIRTLTIFNRYAFILNLDLAKKMICVEVFTRRLLSNAELSLRMLQKVKWYDIKFQFYFSNYNVFNNPN